MRGEVEKLTMDILELSTVGAGSPLSLAGGLDCTVVRGRQAALRPSYTPRLLSEPPSARLLQLALLLQRYVLSSICPCQSWWITGYTHIHRREDRKRLNPARLPRIMGFTSKFI